jgi:hypothetical protein
MYLTTHPSYLDPNKPQKAVNALTNQTALPASCPHTSYFGGGVILPIPSPITDTSPVCTFILLKSPLGLTYAACSLSARGIVPVGRLCAANGSDATSGSRSNIMAEVGLGGIGGEVDRNRLSVDVVRWGIVGDGCGRRTSRVGRVWVSGDGVGSGGRGIVGGGDGAGKAREEEEELGRIMAEEEEPGRLGDGIGWDSSTSRLCNAVC